MKLEEYLQEKYSKSSYKVHLYIINKYLDYIGRKAKTVDYKDILRYIAHLRKNENYTPESVKRYLSEVKIYYNYLLEAGLRNDHPCRELYLKDKINKQVKIDRLYSEETLENYLETIRINPDGKLKKRNEVIVSLLVYQALTVAEICNLNIEDINLEKAEIYIKSEHRKKARTLQLKASQILLFYNYLKEDYPKLTKYLKARRPEKLITGRLQEEVNPNALNRMINKGRKPEERLKPIKIRQSVIAKLLRKENNTRIVQVFAGHKRASTTVQYKQTELEILKNTINNFHPIR
ncbi:site-specific recombinase XerD [Chryseobacterium ginsenosidimutans]|uniref:tyrosine-type recombinase/integrase n=1 Tax=Chryseobacterium ginsenosidimutans TaxID=687846 RepID=UPI002786D493|nr:site-specific integrase [Chryseobacterium ginsenosidimutans]MDQ0593704.1 site-specific recombinase XerD [Chryseobacterium ginsenosidimutans]MDQ0593714.1 site-specific recombinase XerD [Chryseobacterium ginsenosidimutans]